jgi:hypothetical protein
MPPERYSILSAVGFKAAEFTEMTQTGKISSVGLVEMETLARK